MADFLDVERGVRMSRVACTKILHAYILANNLANPENKREIRPDLQLAEMLNYDKARDGKLYYYSMQRLIQPHFM